MDFRPLQLPWRIKANETWNIKEWFKWFFPGCSCCLQALVWTNDILDSVVLVGWRRKNMSKIWTPNWLIVYVHQVRPDVLGYFHGNGFDTGNQPDESFPRILGECVCKELFLTCSVFLKSKILNILKFKRLNVSLWMDGWIHGSFYIVCIVTFPILWNLSLWPSTTWTRSESPQLYIGLFLSWLQPFMCLEVRDGCPLQNSKGRKEPNLNKIFEKLYQK